MAASSGLVVAVGWLDFLPRWTRVLRSALRRPLRTPAVPYDVSIDPEELGRMIPRSDFLLGANGRLDWTTLQNFAYRGIHEMTVVGKAATKEFYGKEPRFAYFSGCSTGGRQGQSEVQRYPQDYDGVLSGARRSIGRISPRRNPWPVALASELGEVPQCKLNAAHRAAVAACDGDDGARDGLVSGAGTCNFDPKALVGVPTDCGVIDAREVQVIRRIWDGPRRRDGSRLWSGIDRAALIQAPQSPGDWASPFFDSKAQADSLSLVAFEALFDQFVERYGAIMDTSSPNLGPFTKRGKTIIWHGVADDIISVGGSLHYVERSVARSASARPTIFCASILRPVLDIAGGAMVHNLSSCSSRSWNGLSTVARPQRFVAKIGTRRAASLARGRCVRIPRSQDIGGEAR